MATHTASSLYVYALSVTCLCFFFFFTELCLCKTFEARWTTFMLFYKFSWIHNAWPIRRGYSFKLGFTQRLVPGAHLRVYVATACFTWTSSGWPWTLNLLFGQYFCTVSLAFLLYMNVSTKTGLVCPASRHRRTVVWGEFWGSHQTAGNPDLLGLLLTYNPYYVTWWGGVICHHSNDEFSRHHTFYSSDWPLKASF